LLGLSDLRLGSIGVGVSRLHGGGIGCGGGHGLIVLLLRNLLLVHQLLVAGEIVLGFDVVGFGFIALGFGGVELLPGGVRTVAQGRVPRGPAFAIVADSAKAARTRSFSSIRA